MSSYFITNKDKFLSDIINGILPKTDAVDILVGYFYYSGYVQLSDNLKSKNIRILVGLDVDLQITKHIREARHSGSLYIRDDDDHIYNGETAEKGC